MCGMASADCSLAEIESLSGTQAKTRTSLVCTSTLLSG